MELFKTEFASPIGMVYVISDGPALRAIDFAGYEDRMHRLLVRHYGRHTLHAARDPDEAASRLADYFAGDLTAIDALKVATNGTPFQRLVWDALRNIPVGTTTSYGTIAGRIGRPMAYRAVGLAVGANPVGIVVPCHRVVGADTRLTGYAGGIERKQWLLSHEGLTFSSASAGPRTKTGGARG